MFFNQQEDRFMRSADPILSPGCGISIKLSARRTSARSILISGEGGYPELRLLQTEAGNVPASTLSVLVRISSL